MLNGNPAEHPVVGADVPDLRTMALRHNSAHEIGFAEQVVRCVMASLRVVGPLRIGPVPTQVVDQFAEPVDQANVDLLVVSGLFQVVDGVRGPAAETSVGLGVQPHVRDQTFAGVAAALQHPPSLLRGDAVNRTPHPWLVWEVLVGGEHQRVQEHLTELPVPPPRFACPVGLK